ncbi:hypothetical protein H2201_008990 [Coniosporium apollinis]|uniref:L-dopachrome isomerase n=1 Tax=Coniosporium apollinis TaxID=61459 RepID=A0ABQ9NHJ6_9PEZI|nr:hypothetical protein H2201_008990 [Coniosporium apollinis]
MSDGRTSSSTRSADAFPLPSGAELMIPENNENGPTSPSKSAFSYEDQPKSPMPDVTEFDRKGITRDVDRGVPGERKDRAIRHQNSSRKMAYYEEQFALKDDTSSARERARKTSPITVELKTNVIVNDEQTFMNELSWHLSNRYQRPPSLIMIFVQHSTLLCVGGTFEPAYLLTINALPTQVQPTTNKRNAAMIQTFMSEILNVPSDRGIIRFEAIPEENLAIHGRTILGEVERLEKQQAEENGSGALKRALTKSSRKSTTSRKDSPLHHSRESSMKPERDRVLPPLSSGPSPVPEKTPMPKDGGFTHKNGYLLEFPSADRKLNSSSDPKTLGTSHSLKGKKSSPGALTGFTHLTPPPIPQDSPLPQMGKRKSFANIFRR